MDKLRNIPESEFETMNPEYHFEEIAEIEQAVASLISQLKEKIKNGEYDTLISDDTGGRIPTLIF